VAPSVLLLESDPSEGGTTTTFLAAVVLGAGLGVMRGGRLAHVAELRLRAWPLLVVAVGIQVVLGWAPTPLRWALVLACCAAVAGWLVANLAKAGMRAALAVLLVGIVANVVVIGANRGMPVSTAALVAAGRSVHTDLAHGFLYKHTAMTPATSLPWLGDRLPIPGIEEVLSFGDVLMLSGLAGISYAATRPRRSLRTYRPTVLTAGP
jgi:hypothetical protein